jgi:tetratricopeptide (TPR) repeat protein
MDSLWYERLAEASASQDSEPEVTIALYQRAIQEKDPSWLCHKGLAMAYRDDHEYEAAIAQVELALEAAIREDAAPKPEAADIVRLHLLLGRYARDHRDYRKADQHYSIACESDDVAQAREGELGRLKARLCFSDAEEVRQWLKGVLASEKGKDNMAANLETIARDLSHRNLVPVLFTLTKEDPNLLKAIVAAMRQATDNLMSSTARASQEGERYAQDEARGVLLFHRGFAAYMYGVTSGGAEPVNEALRLWTEARDVLALVGGSNALMTRQLATEALANHYFQIIMDGLQQLDHGDALTKLTELADSDPDSNFYQSDAIGFLGVVSVLRGNREAARSRLRPRMKQGLQILSDDILDNDTSGLALVQKTLEHDLDYKNAAVALSLRGQPDLVMEALCFEAGDITEVDGESKQRVLGLVSALAEQVVRHAKAQAPDSEQLIERIDTAKEYIEALVNAAEAETKTIEVGADANGEGEKRSLHDIEVAYAYRLVHSRISSLWKSLSTGLITRPWSCDGRAPDGNSCRNWGAGLHDIAYHCIYCADRNFCGDCLAQLRNPQETSGAKITVCNAKHKWLQLPCPGDDLFRGTKAKTVRLPIDVKEDDRILKAIYAEDGEEVTVEAWKEGLAAEWGISLEEIMNDLSSSEANEEGED